MEHYVHNLSFQMAVVNIIDSKDSVNITKKKRNVAPLLEPSHPFTSHFSLLLLLLLSLLLLLLRRCPVCFFFLDADRLTTKCANQSVVVPSAWLLCCFSCVCCATRVEGNSVQHKTFIEHGT
jgi:hypothetical protein